MNIGYSTTLVTAGRNCGVSGHPIPALEPPTRADAFRANRLLQRLRHPRERRARAGNCRSPCKADLRGTLMLIPIVGYIPSDNHRARRAQQVAHREGPYTAPRVAAHAAPSYHGRGDGGESSVSLIPCLWL